MLNTQTETERLNTAMDNMKGITNSQREAIIQDADAFTQLGFKQSEATRAMGTLLTATNNQTQATKLMAMAADLARYKHIDINTAATILARGTQGAARAFKELGITLDTSIPKNKAIAKAFDELNAKIGGQAQAYTKTFAGQMDILKERFQSVFNVVATKLLPIFTTLVGYVGKLIDWIQQNSAALKVFAIGLGFIATAMYGVAAAEAVIEALNPFTYIVAGVALAIYWFVKLWNQIKGFRELMAGMASVSVQAIGLIVGAVAKLLRMLSYIPGLKSLRGLADDADKAAIAIGKTGKSIEDLANKKITPPKMPTISGIIKPGQTTGITGDVPGGGTGKGGTTVMQQITVNTYNSSQFERQMARAAKSGTPIGSK